MSQQTQKTNWGPVLVLGGFWGLSEAALGMYLRTCASTISGSVMTGAALFFLAAAWAVSPRLRTAAAMVAIAAGFKLVDALLLGLPVLHGAIGNPIFAIAMEGAAFALIVSVISKPLAAKAPRPGGYGRLERPRGGQPLPPGQIRDGRRTVRHWHGLPALALLRADRRRTVVPDRPAGRAGGGVPGRLRRWSPVACAGLPLQPSPSRSAPWSS